MDLTDYSAYYDAQTAVLGSLLIEPEKLAGQIMHVVRPEDFSDPVKRNLFAAAREIFLKRETLDAVTLVEHVGAAYSQQVREILQLTPTANNWREYVKLLKDGAMLTRIRDLGQALTEAASAEDGRRLLVEAQGMLSVRPGRRVRNYTEILADFFDRMNDPTPPDFLKFGIEALDKKVRISRGSFVVIGADSSVGKTAFSLQLAYNIAAGGSRVCFFSYETSLEASADRTIANTADARLSDIKAKNISEHVARRAMAEAERSERIPLYIQESAGMTVDDLRAETLCGQYDVIFIDYVQLVPGRSRDSRFETVTATSMALHSMAQELGVTVVALSQVTPPEPGKDGKRRQLRKEDLRESRQLLQDAEAILMIEPRRPEGLQEPARSDRRQEQGRRARKRPARLRPGAHEIHDRTAQRQDPAAGSGDIQRAAGQRRRAPILGGGHDEDRRQDSIHPLSMDTVQRREFPQFLRRQG